MTTKEIIQAAFIDSIKNVHAFQFNTLEAVEANTEKWVHAFLDKAPWINEHTRKTADDWIAAARKGRLQVKEVLDEQIKTVENWTASF